MAGSKPGERRGGRKKGTPNKRTTITHEQIRSGGELPLAYMLRRMRDETVDPKVRDDLAAKAAPYCHGRLASTEVGNKDGKPFAVDISVDANQDLGKAITEILTQARGALREEN